jgi:ribosomal protein L18E
VLARGELTKKLTVRAHAFSGAAREKIEKAGGTVEVLSIEPAAAMAPEPAGDAAEPEQPAE